MSEERLFQPLQRYNYVVSSKYVFKIRLQKIHTEMQNADFFRQPNPSYGHKTPGLPIAGTVKPTPMH